MGWDGTGWHSATATRGRAQLVSFKSAEFGTEAHRRYQEKESNIKMGFGK
jgi:hypothetical protein